MYEIELIFASLRTMHLFSCTLKISNIHKFKIFWKFSDDIIPPLFFNFFDSGVCYTNFIHSSSVFLKKLLSITQEQKYISFSFLSGAKNKFCYEREMPNETGYTSTKWLSIFLHILFISNVNFLSIFWLFIFSGVPHFHYHTVIIIIF